jgi:hypothetical protein
MSVAASKSFVADLSEGVLVYREWHLRQWRSGAWELKDG